MWRVDEPRTDDRRRTLSWDIDLLIVLQATAYLSTMMTGDVVTLIFCKPVSQNNQSANNAKMQSKERVSMFEALKMQEMLILKKHAGMPPATNSLNSQE
jgi:hypothetical protein